jgi:uncharacterized Rmd1/YagE family protein
MRIPFKAWYYRSTIDEEKVSRKFQEYTIEFLDPLVIKIDETHRVMVTSFGAVVFYSFDDEVARLVSSRISETLNDYSVDKEVEDRLIVETDKPEQRFLYSEVWLKTDDSLPTQMRILAMLLAQSVALDHLELEAENAMSGFTRYLEDLREGGRIRMSTRHILKNIGFAMQTRFTVLNNLALFDKPAETWESETIEDLYQGMQDFFDIAERQDVLAAKLDFISENTRMLFEVISSRKNHFLEWIVIILIAVEIVGFGLYEVIRNLLEK